MGTVTTSRKREWYTPSTVFTSKPLDSTLQPLADFFEKSIRDYRRKNVAELYKQYRPKMFKQVIGQRDAVNTLRGLLKKPKKFPHAILFVGPSGCGKTTLGRVVRRKLKCSDMDFTEKDCTGKGKRGIQMIHDLSFRIHMAPMIGPCRVWLLDECHQLTGDAQSALLKLLEDTPRHVYFMLATTEPNKLKPTIITRCTEIKVQPLARQDMDDLIVDVADKEGLDLSESVVAKINEVADGSARKALVLLNQISEIEDEKDQINAVLAADTKRQAIEIARALIAIDQRTGKPKTTWDDMAKILKGVDEDAEQLRRMILGYCTTVLLSNNKRFLARAALIIDVMRDNLYDSGRPALVANCYEIVARGRK